MSYSYEDKTILTIEESDDLRLGIQLTLEHVGYHVLAAKNVPEALELIKGFSSKTHLILCDSAINDTAQLDQLRSTLPDIKIIFLSESDIAPISQNNHHHHLHKPFLPAKLLEEVDKLLS